jgi:hypothetical protein
VRCGLLVSVQARQGVKSVLGVDEVKTPDVGHNTYHGRPPVPSVRDGGWSGMSLAYDLLEMAAVL